MKSSLDAESEKQIRKWLLMLVLTIVLRLLFKLCCYWAHCAQCQTSGLQDQQACPELFADLSLLYPCLAVSHPPEVQTGAADTDSANCKVCIVSI